MTDMRATIVGAGLVPALGVPEHFVYDRHQGDHKGTPLHVVNMIVIRRPFPQFVKFIWRCLGM